MLAVVGADLPARVVELLAEAMDFVTRPWSPPMLRSRVRSWLARAPAGARGGADPLPSAAAR